MSYKDHPEETHTAFTEREEAAAEEERVRIGRIRRHPTSVPPHAPVLTLRPTATARKSPTIRCVPSVLELQPARAHIASSEERRVVGAAEVGAAVVGAGLSVF